ncbi:MAG: hypothetical protein RLW87_20820 [Alphaproteobacteria bacterium]
MFDESEDRALARKRFSTRCGHIKKRLVNGERLEGALLELALELAPDEVFAAKLRKGEKLSDYECHFFVDAVLLHARLAGP